MNSSPRFRVLAGTLIAINIAGLLWIRHEVTGGSGPKLRVLTALPAREVDKTDRFSLIFDEPVAPADQIGRNPGRSPFVVEPAVDGQWLWSLPDRLDFVLDKPLPPGRVFRIKPAADLELLTGRRLVGPAEFTFNTRPLKLESCELGPRREQQVVVNLGFNQPVNPTDLLKHVLLTDTESRRALTPVVLTDRPGERIELGCDPPGSDHLTVLLEPGLTGFGGELPLGRRFERRLEVPVVFMLLGADTEAPSLASEAEVTLRFSGELDTHQPLPQVRIAPEVKGAQPRFSWQGLVMEGPFRSGQRYTVTVGPELKSTDDKLLGSPQSTSFTVPDYEPGVRFPQDRGILSPAGRQELELQAVNVGEVAIATERLHSNNLAAYLGNSSMKSLSRELRKVNHGLENKPNTPTSLMVDLRDVVGNLPGIYRMQVEATDQHWTRDNAIVTISDLGLTTKQSRGRLLVWVTSLRTAKPVAGATVTAITRNNQVIVAALTGDDGVAELTIPPNHPDGPPWMVTAESGDDLNYLLPEKTGWGLDGIDVSGREVPETYDVLMYSERGVYRPGEVVHLTGLVRDAAGSVPPSLPLAITVRRPDGKEVATLEVTADPQRQGFFHADYTPPEDGQMGAYRFFVGLPGSPRRLSEMHVFVEAYVPARLEVKAQATQETFGRFETPRVEVSGRYLFGQPASGLAVSGRAHYRRVSFKSAMFPAFSFDDPAAGAREQTDEIEAELDDAGQATLELPAPRAESVGIWESDTYATVTESGGRSISQQVAVRIDTAERHVGLRLPGGKIVPAQARVPIEWVQMTGADELAEAGPMTYSMQRVAHDTVIEMVNDRPVWKAVEHLTSIDEGPIEPGKQPRGILEVTCPAAGCYRLEVADSLGGSLTRIEFDATADSSTAGITSASRPERLELTLARDEYLAGEEALIAVTSPFAGTLLLTLESDRVLDRQIVEMTGNLTTVSLRVPTDLRGSAFVTATVIRGVDPAQNKWLPHRAIGMVRLSVSQQPHILSLDMNAPSQARPGETIAVAVRTPSPLDPARPAYVHCWAVDEGILMTTGYGTPDPLAHFFAPRGSAVGSADLFGLLLPDYQRAASIARIGAGDEGDFLELDTRLRNPETVRREAPAIIWHEAASVGLDGLARFEMLLPEITGRLRLMAVAADQDHYGTTQHDLTLTAPLLVESTWPRFAAPGDHFKVPVKLFNTTPEPLQVQLSITDIDGPLRFEETGFESLTVPASGNETIWLSAETTNVGPASLQVRATATSGTGEALTAVSKARFTVRPASSLHAQTQLERLPAGQTLTIAPPDIYLPGSVHATAGIGADPNVELQPALQQLIDYPYGCVEQTASRLYAMLNAPRLLVPEDAHDMRGEAARRMIDVGIGRLWSMQTSSGGLAYWPGGSEPNLWASAYVGNFLRQAKRNGHEVDAAASRALIDYLTRELNQQAEGDANLQTLICHVLAGFGQPPEGWMARLTEKSGELDMAGRAHLVGAWLEIGRKDRATDILAEGTQNLLISTTTSGRITSQIGQEATLLNVLLDLDPRHPWVVPLVQRLNAARSEETGGWGTTLENAMSLAALARYQMLAPHDAKFEGTAGLVDRALLAFNSETPLTLAIKPGQWPLRIASSGSGDVNVSVTFHGLLKQKTAQDYDHRLRVRRRWLNLDGQEIDTRELRVGDLVRVEVELVAPDLKPGDGEAGNVSIVDALPAGLEAENPRLATSARGGDDKEYASPDRVEFLDDRVLLFASAGREKKTFGYDLRVVTEGQFAAPAVQASCMYDPTFASLHGGGSVTVQR